MLVNTLDQLGTTSVQVYDDGSEWSINQHKIGFNRTAHTGKKGFWKKWFISKELALGTDHDWFLFIPDDLIKINLKKIENLTKQGWDDRYLAINIINGGAIYRWGVDLVGQPPIELDGNRFTECCYVDGAFLTNRKTLQAIEINPVPESWFDSENKSSGVGHQMTMQLRKLRAPMLIPEKSLAYHGDHLSEMHPKERLLNPLISKM